MPFRQDRLLDIETRLDMLSKENAELRRRVNLNMRHDHVCPKCEHEEVVYARYVLDHGDGGRARLALVQPSAWSGQTEGEFEAFVCRACGLVEWYAKEPSEIGAHAKSKEAIEILTKKEPNT